MKKFACTLMLSLLLVTPGCISTLSKKSIERNVARADELVEKINNGNTTREQDQGAVRAMRVYAWALNWNINGITPPLDVQLKLKELGLAPEGE